MSSTARAAAAALTVLLVTAMVAVLVLRMAGAPIAQGPAAGATGSPSGEPTASPPSSPSPTPPTDAPAVLAGIEADVRELRGLPAPDIGAPDVITRAELADEVQAIVDEGWTPDELRRANLTLQAMGLLTADQDLAELTARLLEGEVIGFYDFTRRRMVVVSDAGLTPVARVTYAHEYTHALQDGAFGSGAQLDGLTDDDTIAAYQALLEGDATLLMFQWAFSHLGADELGEIGSTPLPDTSGIPDWMVRQLEWPYLAGLNFLASVSGMTVVPGAGGDWSAVDDIYADPPASTEQVLHPEKYLDGEQPMEVDPVGVAEILGDAWEDLLPNTVGEAMTSIWLTELGAATVADVAAEGWGGDRQTVAVGPDGAWAMAWRIAFDSAADQDQFESALGLIRPGLVSYRQTSDTELILLTGSSDEVVLRLADAIGPPAS